MPIYTNWETGRWLEVTILWNKTVPFFEDLPYYLLILNKLKVKSKIWPTTESWSIFVKIPSRSLVTFIPPPMFLFAAQNICLMTWNACPLVSCIVHRSGCIYNLFKQIALCWEHIFYFSHMRTNTALFPQICTSVSLLTSGELLCIYVDVTEQKLFHYVLQQRQRRKF